jgi:iron-sulfur cluster assembly protein
MIQVTEKAAKEIKRILDKDGNANSFLRVSVVAGGCSGMSYKLAFDNTKKETDKEFQHDGVTLLVDPKSILFITGTTLDFSDGLEGTGFNFVNPNAKKNCGCGSSFST